MAPQLLRVSVGAKIYNGPAFPQNTDEAIVSTEGASMSSLLGLSGSLRAGSFNTALLRAAAGLMPAGSSLEVATLHGIPLYDGDAGMACGRSMKVAVVGAGKVGSACLLSLVMRGTARELAGHDRVLSTGTFLDTLRFRFHLARCLGVHPMSVDAQVLGEHGTSQVFIWSCARIGGTPIHEVLGQGAQQTQGLRQRIEQEVRFANITIIEGTGASQFGIGMVAARIADAILRDEQAVIPIGAYNDRCGVTLSLPAVVGRHGVSRLVEPHMTDGERKALDESVNQLRRAVARLGSAGVS